MVDRYRVVYTTGATSYQAMIILYGSRPISDEYIINKTNSFFVLKDHQG